MLSGQVSMDMSTLALCTQKLTNSLNNRNLRSSLVLLTSKHGRRILIQKENLFLSFIVIQVTFRRISGFYEGKGREKEKKGREKKKKGREKEEKRRKSDNTNKGKER